MIYKYLFQFVLIFFIILNVNYANALENTFNRIEVLVNEKIITNFDIVQRIKINAFINKVDINQNNLDLFAKTVVDELVIEILKNEKLIEYEVTYTQNEYKEHEQRYFQQLNLTGNQVKELFTQNDIYYKYFRSFIETELMWQKLIYGLYFRVTSVTDIEKKELQKNQPNLSESQAYDIILQRQLDLKSEKLITELRDEATIEYKN